MLKYNLKGFFKDVVIHNDDWVSNGHFMFKKSILTTGQQKILGDYPQDTNKINSLIDIAETAKKIFDGSRKQLEFIPESIFEVETRDTEGEIKETYKALYNNDLDLALREEYYNLFTSRKCKIFKGNGSLNPALIFKDDEFVGVLLPIRNNAELREDAIDYNSYITQLKQQHEEKADLKELNKKCLYIVNNKAVVRSKPLKSVSELIGDDKYNNLYMDAVADKFGDVELFVDLDIVHMSLGRIIKLSNFLDDIEYYAGGYSHINLKWYEEYIMKCLDNNSWVNIAEVELMKLTGRPTEFIDELLNHRENIKMQREEKDRLDQLQKEQEEKEYVDSQNKLVDDLIREVEEKILNGGKIINNDVTIYESRHSSNTTSLILHMMKLYDIKVPLKTQGWINKALHSIYKNEGKDHYTYNYYNSSSNSTVFSKYLDILADKVKDKYKNVA